MLDPLTLFDTFSIIPTVDCADQIAGYTPYTLELSLKTNEVSIQQGDMELTRTFPATLTAMACVNAEIPPLAAV